MAGLWLQMLLLALVILCAAADLRSGKIRNAVVLPAGVAGAVLRLLNQGPAAVPVLLFSAAVPFILLYPFWRWTRGKGIGAGDIKLLMAVAVMTPAWSLLPLLAFSFISAGVYGFFRYLVRGLRSAPVSGGIHMAVFIAAGTCMHVAGFY